MSHNTFLSFTAVLFCSILCYTAAATVVVNGHLETPLFPTDNWWYISIESAPVDPSSDSIIDYIGRTDGMHPDFGAVMTCGISYGVVSSNTPLVPVTFLYAGESDAGAPGRPPGYPIPEEAKTNTMIEGAVPGGGLTGDRHLLLVDQHNRLLFETWATRWNGTNWFAGSGAVFELDTNNRRPEGWTSADAAGLAILPGLVRAEEVFEHSNIVHAIRATVHGVNGYVFPASHNATTDQNSPIPLGARLRLKPGTAISNFPLQARVIMQAMKTYGIIIADTGADLYFQGTSDPRWNNDILNPAFRAVTADDFEVVELGWIIPEPLNSCMPALFIFFFSVPRYILNSRAVKKIGNYC